MRTKRNRDIPLDVLVVCHGSENDTEELAFGLEANQSIRIHTVDPDEKMKATYTSKFEDLSTDNLIFDIIRFEYCDISMLFPNNSQIRVFTVEHPTRLKDVRNNMQQVDSRVGHEEWPDNFRFTNNNTGIETEKSDETGKSSHVSILGQMLAICPKQRAKLAVIRSHAFLT